MGRILYISWVSVTSRSTPAIYMYPIDKLKKVSVFNKYTYVCILGYSFPFLQAYHLLQLSGEETGDIPGIRPALRVFPTDEAASFHPMSMSKCVKN